MRLFSKKSNQETLSPVAKSIYDSLCIEPLNWYLKQYHYLGLFIEGWDIGLFNNKFDIKICPKRYIESSITPIDDNNNILYYPDIISRYECNMICDKAKEVIELLENINISETIKGINERHSVTLSSKFDDNVRSLAKCILKNDKSAAMPFLDSCIENMK